MADALDGQSARVVSGGDDAINEEELLYLRCSEAFKPRTGNIEELEDAEASWDPAQDWIEEQLEAGKDDIVKAAAEYRADSGLTALHIACMRAPPPEVIELILSITEEPARWPDTHGCLPIHYACRYEAHEDVIHKLVEVFPDSRTAVDNSLRTPLLLAFSRNLDEPPTAFDSGVIDLLSSSGAAELADSHGMLPLHLAIARVATQENLYVLTGAYSEAVHVVDKNNRTPLQMACSNAKLKGMDNCVRHLVNIDKSVVNGRKGRNPLRALSDFALGMDDNEEERETVGKCLEHILAAHPDPTADFFTALQSLPEWLSETAVVIPQVQDLLNLKIAQRFPSAILMCDFFFVFVIIFSYSYNIVKSLKARKGGDVLDDEDLDYWDSTMILLYLGGLYFLLREIIQMISLISLKAFHMWFYDSSNWLNVLFVFIVLWWTVRMQNGKGDVDSFQIGAALSVPILWIKLLEFLRNMLIQFAVFVGGLYYVVNRLAAFLISLSIILIAFAQMFWTLFIGKEACKGEDPFSERYALEVTKCDDSVTTPYCFKWDAFLNVVTMLLGELDESTFEGDTVSTVLFIFFEFLVVILLANVLIAIVTDSYKVIQDERAAIVFWTNRLDFVAEMDAIANGPWKGKLMAALGKEEKYDRDRFAETKVDDMFGYQMWDKLMDVFESRRDGDMTDLFEIFLTFLARVWTAIVVIPLWVILGILTAGWFWPPQMRELFFASPIKKHASDTEKEDEQRKTQVLELEQEVLNLREELRTDLAVYRTQVAQMKNSVSERKAEIAAEMKNVKRIVTLLFEQQASYAG